MHYFLICWFHLAASMAHVSADGQMVAAVDRDVPTFTRPPARSSNKSTEFLTLPSDLALEIVIATVRAAETIRQQLVYCFGLLSLVLKVDERQRQLWYKKASAFLHALLHVDVRHVRPGSARALGVLIVSSLAGYHSLRALQCGPTVVRLTARSDKRER